MDNAKLWFMYNVLVGHGVQFIYPLVFKNKLTYLEGLHDFFTWQDVHMHSFMFISGTFASEKLTQVLCCSLNVPRMFAECSPNVPCMLPERSQNAPGMFPDCSLIVP
jgi:hypothetical protein